MTRVILVIAEKNINPELWQACAGPLVNLPPAGSHVIYFPQGHSEQVAASLKKDVDAQIPNYPNLPSKLLCLLQSLTLHVCTPPFISKQTPSSFSFFLILNF